MTRPSEAEVTEAMQRLRDMADVYGPDADDIPLDEECPATVGDLYRVLDHIAAALSTPPLPSAEPVHEGDGLTWTEFRNHVARVLADAGQHGLRVAFLRRCFTDTTRPPPRRKPRAD